MKAADAPKAPTVGSASHVMIVARYTFVNFFRARRFYVMLSIVLLMSTLLTVAVGYYRPALFGFAPAGAPVTAEQSRTAFYSLWWAGFVNILVILSAAFFGGDAISGEYQNKTGYFLLPNPIRRSSVFVGKYIAALLASSLMLGIYALIAITNGMYYFGAAIPSGLAYSLLYGWFYLVAAMSLTFMFSSAFKSSSVSILMMVILLLFVFDLVDLVVGVIANVEPWFSITYAEQIIGLALSGPSGGGPFPGVATFTPTIPEGLAIMAAYFLVTGLLGLVLFEKKQFT